MKPLKILYVITCLDAGGAERCLQQTLLHLSKTQFSAHVLCLKKNGVIGQELQAKGYVVNSLSIGSITFSLFHFIKIIRKIYAFQPDIIHAWMYHGIIFSFFLKIILFRSKWIWSIHNKDISARGLTWPTRQIAKFLGHLSPLTRSIIYNSEGAKHVHENLGYSPHKNWVLRNGYNLNIGRILTQQEKYDRRQQLGWPIDSYVVGYISRWHPQKDVMTFLHAAQFMEQNRHLKNSTTDVSLNKKIAFVCLGQGFSEHHEPWWSQVKALGLTDNILCREWQSPIEYWIEAFDLLILSSIEESLPNVLGEAMVCGVPWVSTDVGDVRYLLIPPCQVVERENPESLAMAALSILNESHHSPGHELRQFILEKFSLSEQQQILQEHYTCVTNTHHLSQKDKHR